MKIKISIAIKRKKAHNNFFRFICCFYRCCGAGSFCLQTFKSKNPEPLSLEQQAFLEQSLDKKYPERTDIVSELPFQYVPADLFVNAESAIVVDFATGNILFEKMLMFKFRRLQ